MTKYIERNGIYVPKIQKNNNIIHKNKTSKFFRNFISKSCKVICLLLAITLETMAKIQQK